MNITLTPEERDDILLALREWVYDLEEPLAKPRSALARRRREKAKRVAALADRLYMADLIGDEPIIATHLQASYCTTNAGDTPEQVRASGWQRVR